MSARVEGNKIIIPIEIALEDKTELQQMTKQIQDLQASTSGTASDNIETTIKELIDEDLNEAVENEVDDFVKSDKLGFLSDPDVKRGMSQMMNPEGAILSTITKFAPEIGILLMTPQVIDLIIKFLTGPGGPFDVRFRRDIENEINFQLSLQEQQARKIGLKQIIITSDGGYRNLNGAGVTNTFNQIKNMRVSTIDVGEKSKGFR